MIKLKSKLLLSLLTLLIMVSCIAKSRTTPIPTPTPTFIPTPTSTLTQLPSHVSYVTLAILKIEPAVVQIITDDGTGSGVVIDTSGYVMTSNHVVEKSSSITVVFQNGYKINAVVWSRDIFLDIAVLKLYSNAQYAAAWGDSSNIKLGEDVVALGFPLGLGGSITATRGIISAFRPHYLQTDAAINFGNSGGPLINMQGEVIGIVTWKAIAGGKESAEGIAFAIPANEIKQGLREMMTPPSRKLIPLTVPPSIVQISKGFAGIGASLVPDYRYNIHILWGEKVGLNYQIMYSVRDSQGFWVVPKDISNSSQWSTAPAAVVDNGGTLHVVWNEHESKSADRYDIFYATKRLGEEWSVPVKISQTGVLSASPELIIDTQDTLHLVWTEGDYIVYSQKQKEDVWTRATRIQGTENARPDKSLGIDSKGNLFLILTSRDGEQIYLHEKRKDSSWSLPEPIDSHDQKFQNPEIALDHQDRLHILWWEGKTGATKIMYRFRGKEGKWSSPVTLSGTDRSASHARITIDSDGRVHALWLRHPDTKDGMPALILSCRSEDGTWSTPKVVHEGPGSAPQAITVDKSGAVHILIWGSMKVGEDASIRYVMVPSICR